MKSLTIWLRDEARQTERRTPLLPDGARELISAGLRVVVEKSSKRIIHDRAYEEAGCQLVESGSWTTAPSDAVILGLKELPPEPAALNHTHIYFAHAYKGQAGWCQTLSRFIRGGGSLLDIEYMTRENGRRVVAFGYWAGYMGAALALMQWYDRATSRPSSIAASLEPFDCARSLDQKIAVLAEGADTPKALVIGAGGRSGTGATEILERHGIKVTKWGRAETATIDHQSLLAHDIVVNCAFVNEMIPPFLTADHLSGQQRLKVISDVSCDPFSDFNPLPLYHAPTSWDSPVLAITGGVDLIAIDNLPSLLPTEASEEFAGLLLPYLKSLPTWQADPVWMACDDAFTQAVTALVERKAS